MTSPVADLSDEALLARVRGLVRQSNALTAELLQHLAEVDARKLYANAACSSLFTWCVTELGMSEDMAYKRISAARAARRFPALLERLAEGRLHLAGICLLTPHLSEENHLELVEAASGRSKRQLEQFLADRAPRPDEPTRIRRFPASHEAGGAGRPTRASEAKMGLFAGQVGTAGPDSLRSPDTASPAASEPELAPGRVVEPPAEVRQAPSPLRPPSPRRRVEPLGAERYKVQFTADQAWMDKLREATALLSHRVPGGDVAVVLEHALTALCEKLMKERFSVSPHPGRTDASRQDPPAVGATSEDASPKESPSAPAYQVGAADPGQEPEENAFEEDHKASAATADGADGEDREPPVPGGSRYIPASVRRRVVERDGLRCTFVDARGRRCEETRFLELHHRLPWARGGTNTADNLTLRCRCHNDHAAMLDFGPRVPPAAGRSHPPAEPVGAGGVPFRAPATVADPVPISR